ncbi:hypothetical protein [Propionivibrio sp.]|uniref:hypothetical protein n=1 Tax=Propionivibrio sp. TaxID=2212460 RepID=UPI003BF445F1
MNITSVAIDFQHNRYVTYSPTPDKVKTVECSDTLKPRENNQAPCNVFSATSPEAAIRFFPPLRFWNGLEDQDVGAVAHQELALDAVLQYPRIA